MELINKGEKGVWVNALRSGDQKALTYYFDCHYIKLGYYAGKLVDDHVEAENIVADCFFLLWEKHDIFQNEEHIKAFLYACCRNLCLNYLRNQKRRSAKQAEYLDQLEESEETILNEIIEAEFLSMLNLEICKLPTKCQEVFKYIFFEHKKTEEIAAIMGTTNQTVRNHKARAIDLLKTAMLKRGISGSLLIAFLFFIDIN